MRTIIIDKHCFSLLASQLFSGKDNTKMPKKSYQSPFLSNDTTFYLSFRVLKFQIESPYFQKLSFAPFASVRSTQVRSLTQTKIFDDGTVAADIAVVQVVQQRAAFADQHRQSPFSSIIFSVELHVLGQTGNTVGKQSYLGLS